MTKNRRYEAHYDALNDMRIEEAASTLTPTTLPMQAMRAGADRMDTAGGAGLGVDLLG